MNIRADILGERQLLRKKRAKRSDRPGLVNIAITREETRRANNRNEDRVRPSSTNFRIAYAGKEYDAHVVNLSGGGAMIDTDLFPRIGDHLLLRHGETGSIECAVRWIKDGKLGLEFAPETQLHSSADQIAALLRDVLDRDFPSDSDPGAAVDPTPAATPGRSDDRLVIRHPLIWSGNLHHGSSSTRVRLRNISAIGALVECSGELVINSEVFLDLGKAGSLRASVSWAVGDHAGLKFDEPFDLRRLPQSKPKVAPPTWMRPAYLEGDGQAGCNSTADSWDNLSLEELRERLEGFLKH